MERSDLVWLILFFYVIDLLVYSFFDGNLILETYQFAVLLQ